MFDVAQRKVKIGICMKQRDKRLFEENPCSLFWKFGMQQLT